MTFSTRMIQERLIGFGYDPGRPDGIRGRRTIAAIRAFQTDAGLRADGIVGPLTRARMLAGGDAGQDQGEPDRPWYEEARRLLGTRETPGPGSNATILDWAGDLDLAYSGDDIPWCGLFAAHCIGATLPREELPQNVLGARNWQRFGQAAHPSKGAILVFWRGRRDGWQGHVGFYAGEDARSYYVLGGNQSDSVSVARLDRERLLACRWPTTAGYGETVRVTLTPDTSPFSTDEA